MIDSFKLDSDEGNWLLTLEGDDGSHTFVLTTTEGVLLYEELEAGGLVSYVREMRAAERAWKRMTPLERARALGDNGLEDSGYDLDDPKHPTYAQRMADAADELRKRAKGE